MARPSDHYQVTIVKYGTRRAMRSDVYLNYPVYGVGDASIEMDYFFWIVKNSERTIVVDTGFSAHGGAVRNRTALADVGELLAHHGASPDDSPQVVLTHGHYDHIGNVALFPTSKFFMASEEFTFWSSPFAQRAMFHHSVEDDEIEGLRHVANEGRLELFEGRVDVAPGVEAIVVGGHTPGQCVVRVQTSEGPVLLASDAIHYYEEYERDMLFMSVSNLIDMYEGFDRVREMIRLGEVQHLVSGHDPDTLARFAPTTGKFAALAATIGTLDESEGVQP